MILAYSEDYHPDVQPLLEAQALPWQDQALCSLMVLDQGRVKGIGSLSLNPYHPHRTYIRAHILPGPKQKTYAQDLLQALIEAEKPGPFQALVPDNQLYWQEVLVQAGFNLARTTYLASLTLADIPTPKEAPLPLLTLSELEPRQVDQVLALQWNNYQDSHQGINPLTPSLSLADWKELLEADLSLQHSYALLDHGKVQGYALAYPIDGRSQDIELAYLGGKDWPQGSRLMDFFLEVFHKLLGQFQTLEMEIDSTDPYATQVFNQLDLQAQESWLTYTFEEVKCKRATYRGL